MTEFEFGKKSFSRRRKSQGVNPPRNSRNVCLPSTFKAWSSKPSRPSLLEGSVGEGDNPVRDATAAARGVAVRESGCLGLQPKTGGRLHPRRLRKNNRQQNRQHPNPDGDEKRSTNSHDSMVPQRKLDNNNNYY